MNRNLLGKLLRKNVSAGQLIGFALANVIGLCIVMIGLQFYADVRTVFSSEDSFINKDYLVLTKKVGGLDAVGGLFSRGNSKTGVFASKEIAQLSSQPWVRKLGTFSSSRYNVTAVVAQPGQGGLETQMFFESMPEEFLDVEGAAWHFDPVQPQEVPVIIPKDYLALYNFGFASSQGLPRVSEGMVGLIPIQFYLTGSEGQSLSVTGHIVGFSSRINTIIVPESFMEWSSRQLGTYSSVNEVSRIILEVSQPGDAKVEQYLNAHNYEVAGDKMNRNKANYLLTISLVIVLAVGLLISTLSFFILTLSIHLLLQKNTEKLRILLLLGYSPFEVALPYERLVSLVNLAVYVLATGVLFWVRCLYLPRLDGLATPSSIFSSLGLGLIIILLISVGNIIAIRRFMRRLRYL
ncbi:ABC transporter permease [Porphyromonas endodontalis]|jgi:hypothetical protein